MHRVSSKVALRSTYVVVAAGVGGDLACAWALGYIYVESDNEIRTYVRTCMNNELERAANSWRPCRYSKEEKGEGDRCGTRERERERERAHVRGLDSRFFVCVKRECMHHVTRWFVGALRSRDGLPAACAERRRGEPQPPRSRKRVRARARIPRERRGRGSN
jgi:hypothetical protein